MVTQPSFEYVIVQLKPDDPFICPSCRKIFAVYGNWIAARNRGQDGQWFGVGDMKKIRCPHCEHAFDWVKIYLTMGTAQQACNMMNRIGHGMVPLLALQPANASAGGS